MARMHSTNLAFATIILLLSLLSVIDGATDAQDVTALTTLYVDLQQPPQLTNWNTSGGDPCTQNWLGVVCVGANVTELHLSNLGLTGQLGYGLSGLQSLLYFNVSTNNIGGIVPNQLPPSIQNLILAGNHFIGSLPYSIHQLSGLIVLDLSQNAIGNGVPDVFTPLVSLTTLDLSYNTLTGGLPNSLGDLTALRVLNLESNQLNGNLPLSLSNLTNLQVLNIQNNQFTGWIPPGLHPPTFIFGGNQFSTSPAPPPPSVVPPPPLTQLPPPLVSPTPSSTPPAPPLLSPTPVSTPPAPPLLSPTPLSTPPASPVQSPPPVIVHNSPVKSPASAAVVTGSKRFWTPGWIAGIAIAALFLLVATSLGLMFCLWRLCGKRISVSDEEKVHGQGGSQAQPLSSPLMKGKSRQSNPRSFATAGQVEEVMTMRASPVVQILKAPPSLKGISEKGQAGLSSGKSPSTVIAATAFSIADLQMATNSFAQENLIGEGSLGRVYRGDFPDGQVVAVKKLDTSAAQVQDNEEFLAAVCTMAHLQHANIMELIGYCAEHGQHLLVYQYMNGGTLNDTLHTSDKTALHISWNMRVKIALGAARALEYLHEVCLPAMVHRNFKSANILLDDETIPHLSDCGIAAFIPIDGERQISAQMLGSLGYSAPEYTMSGLYTMQSDVYSFGVVLLELLTGRKPFDSTRTRSEQSLVRWATPQLHDIDALVKMVDPALKGMYPAKSLSRFADIIALCVQPEPEFRPPMSEVVEALVRLMQRASLNQQRSRDNSSGSRHISDQHEPSDFT